MPEQITAIIQSRLGSSRLPGKAMLEIAGKPVLQRVVDRVRAVNVLGPGLIDDIIVATTTNSEDDKIAEWCQGYGVKFFRGHPTNVLKRYYDCALRCSADWILRITSDLPFVNPVLIIGLLLHRPRREYSALAVNKGNVIDGEDGELFSFAELERVYNLGFADEHVSTRMRSKDEDILDIVPDSCYKGIKTSLDTPEDWEKLKRYGELMC